MSMDGKRYAAGLLAGLLVGFLVVVAGSQGVFTANFGPFMSAGATEPNHQSESTTTTFLATTTASTTLAANLQKAPNASSSSTTTTNQGIAQAVSTTNSTYSTTSSVPDFGFVAEAGLSSNTVPSSSLYSIVHQPVFSDVIVLIPLLLAFFLGAVIYRLSGSKDKE